ncbi:MAG: tetratricopeptide repeat protein [Bacteroidetes bacterium]|nr:tetratricopeptide repeat protein [Bacteroidota bacterium]
MKKKILREEGLMYNQLAEQYYSQKKYDEAIIECQKAIKLIPDLFNPYWIYGAILAEQGQKEESKKLLEKAISLNPINPGIHNSLGALLATDPASIDAAIQSYLKAVELDGKFWKAHYNLSLIYQKKGENYAAFNEGIKSWRIHPSLMTLSNLFRITFIVYPKYVGGTLAVLFLLPFLIRSKYSLAFTAILLAYFLYLIKIDIETKNFKKALFDVLTLIGILILHINFMY